jgi:hypothetical protein
MALIKTVNNFKQVMNKFNFDVCLAKLKKWKPDYEKIIRAIFKNELM